MVGLHQTFQFFLSEASKIISSCSPIFSKLVNSFLLAPERTVTSSSLLESTPSPNPSVNLPTGIGANCVKLHPPSTPPQAENKLSESEQFPRPPQELESKQQDTGVPSVFGAEYSPQQQPTFSVLTTPVNSCIKQQEVKDTQPKFVDPKVSVIPNCNSTLSPHNTEKPQSSSLQKQRTSNPLQSVDFISSATIETQPSAQLPPENQKQYQIPQLQQQRSAQTIFAALAAAHKSRTETTQVLKPTSNIQQPVPNKPPSSQHLVPPETADLLGLFTDKPVKPAQKKASLDSSLLFEPLLMPTPVQYPQTSLPTSTNLDFLGIPISPPVRRSGGLVQDAELSNEQIEDLVQKWAMRGDRSANLRALIAGLHQV